MCVKACSSRAVAAVSSVAAGAVLSAAVLSAVLTLYVYGGQVADVKAADSCSGRCGDSADFSFTCQCNTVCSSYGDCCSDYTQYCSPQTSCFGKCAAAYDNTLPCQCNTLCPNYGNCCSDYDSHCSGGGTDPGSPSDISAFADSIWQADTTRAKLGSDIVVNYGGQTSSSSQTDKAPSKLFTSVDTTVLQRATFKAMTNLFDNYITTQGNTETRTAAELAEEDAFMDAIFGTDVMTQAYDFVTANNYFAGTQSQYKDFVRGLLFDPYDRKAAGDTSGFEHVFVGEWSSSSSVSGFHNWVQMYLLEQGGDANYHGYLAQGQNGILKYQFSWSGRVKSISSIMIGASPEFEVAMFSTCFMKSPNAACKVTLNGGVADVQTYDYKGLDVFGSAYFIG